MALVCALSNEVTEHAVISPSSGYIYEKRLILKYIQDNGTDPMTNEALNPEQLIEVKSNPLIKPKPPSATSIPALLKSLQDEWDSVMLHSFTTRQQLQTARQELSHALYQHDAACRVIARLTKEVTAAREALATLKPQMGSATSAPSSIVPQTMYAAETNGDHSMKESVEEGISEEVIQKLQEKSSSLTAIRKTRGKKLSEDLATIEDIKSYTCIGSQTGLHSASTTGITALDVKPNDPNKIVTGGNDKTAVVFNNSTEQIVATLKGHTKKLTAVIYHPDQDVVISASADSTIRIWSVAQQQQTQFLKIHDSSVTGISLHPLGDYLLSCSTDEHWAFSNIVTGQNLVKVSSAASAPAGASDGENIGGNSVALTACKFHPDGLIFATGTSDSVVKIWDLKSKTNLANFPGHQGAITSMSFSENGYYLATSAEDSTVKLWDLRKLKNFKTIEFGDKFEVKDLVFDHSGTYLACAGTDVRVYHVKQWELLKTFTDHAALVTGVRFGKNAQCLATCSLDKSLKIFSKAKAE
jgi:pre-mRNA-processing factor 19